MITIVVSVYNTGKYLKNAMDGLLNQTYPDYELILVDDGSTDGSADLCDQQAQGRPNVRVFHKPNGGLSSARNFGIDHARGDWIIFPDPDDWVEKDYLEKLEEARERRGADLSICGFYVEYADGQRMVRNELNTEMEINDKENALHMLMHPLYYGGFAWNKLYSMDVIRKNGLRFDEELGMAQDLHFAVRYIMCCESIVYNPKPLYHYYQGSGGVTTKKSPLTPRKMSGLLTYKKIAEITQAAYPRIAAISYSSLCRTCLTYIGIYYRAGMRDRGILTTLRKYFTQYRKYFYSSDIYTAQDKKCAWAVTVHPWLYYHLYRAYRRFLSKPDATNNMKT